jgi:hypothetical protein
MYDLRMPILSLQAAGAGSGNNSYPALLDTLHFSDRYIGWVSETVHGDFSEIKPMLVPALAGGAKLEPELERAQRGYVASCRYVLRFLDGVLKGDADGLSFAARSSGENGMDERLINVQPKPAVAIPTEHELVTLVTEADFETASRVLRSAQEAHPSIQPVREQVMNFLARRSLSESDPDAAINAYRLNIQVHSRSARAYDGLADAYLAAGDSLMVIRTYERLLQVLPTDTTLSEYAKQRISQNANLRLQILRPQNPSYPSASRGPA